MTNWLFITLEVAIIASAVVAGAFLTFSDFVMRSLGKAQVPAGVEVMQIVNREVFPTIFMVLLLGMSALSPMLATYAWFSLAGQKAMWIMAGGAFYFFGVFVVSMVFNVPMNGQLDRLQFTGSEAASYWQETYLPRWALWNYVRAITAAAAAICFLVASGV